ncbi:MAG: signal peptidase I [Synergistaceae bacterium]|jgi:signal peptidase I|nr:signal peptidase I [Synergistaceae bacterium]
MPVPKPWWRDVLETIVYAIVLALLIRTFVIQAFWIPSSSMVPALEPGDRVMVLKFWHHLPKVELKRFQIVVFKYPVDPRRDFVKRLIGLPGDKVEIIGGRVFINDREIAEPYVQNPDSFTMAPEIIPPGNYFCLGDNRINSQDSRFWGFVKEDLMRGPAVFRYWPLSRAGLLD